MSAPAQIFEAIMSDMDEAVLSHDWEKYRDRCKELRRWLAPLLVDENPSTDTKG